MKEKINRLKNYQYKCLWIFFAVNLLGIAITCFLKSGLGCDPIALLSSGISEALSTSFGIASFLYNVVTICMAYLFAKKFLGAGTVVYGLLSGFVIDIYGIIFQNLSISANSMTSCVLFFIVGEVFMSAAFAILMHLDLGMTALDALLTTLNKKTGVSYAIFKIITDAIFVITGTLLGGAFGIGTIISVAVTGILVTKIGNLIKGFGYVKKEERDTSDKKELQL